MFLWMASRLRSINAQIRPNSLTLPQRIFIYTLVQPQHPSRDLSQPSRKQSPKKDMELHERVPYTDEEGRQRVNRWSRPSPSPGTLFTLAPDDTPSSCPLEDRWARTLVDTGRIRRRGGRPDTSWCG